MTLAWKSKFASTKKMVLLALCDNANDQGECFPSVSMLAEKCSLSERGVFKQLAELEELGAIKRNNRTGRSTVYQLDPCTWCTPEPSAPLNDVHTTPEQCSPPKIDEPLNNVHPTPERGAPTPEPRAPITIKESSIEPKSKKDSANALTSWPGISDSVFSDFLQIRKAKKQPLTKTAMAGIEREAAKAGLSLLTAVEACCEYGWAGFNAKWYAERNAPARAGPAETTYQRSMREKWETLTGRNSKTKPTEIFDVTPLALG